MEITINFRRYPLREALWFLPAIQLVIETKELYIDWLCFEIAINIK